MDFVLSILLTAFTLIYISGITFLFKGINRLKNFNDRNINFQNLPGISVIIAARNEQNNLPGLFNSLENIDYPADKIEFIIVNDRSGDGTAKLIEEQEKKDRRFRGIHITTRDKLMAPKKKAIDTALQKSKYDLILLTDADGRPGKLWVQAIVANFKKGADFVIGYAPYQTAKSKIIQGILALEYFSHAAVAASTSGLGYAFTCVGTNLAYRKKIYLEADGFGPFKQHISGDDDLFLTHIRSLKKYAIRYACGENSFVYNNPPRSFIQFFHQRLRYASKGFEYPVKITLILSAYVIFNLLLLISFFISFYSSVVFFSFIITLILKNISEFTFLKKAGNVIGETRVQKYYWITAILHVPYVLFFAISGQLRVFRWAEPSVEKGVQE